MNKVTIIAMTDVHNNNMLPLADLGNMVCVVWIIANKELALLKIVK